MSGTYSVRINKKNSDQFLNQKYFNKARGLCAYNPVTFTGFIAQDVLESCIPNLVTGTEIEGYGLDYNGILTMVVKGFQEQQCTICSQASIINTLKTCLGIA